MNKAAGDAPWRQPLERGVTIKIEQRAFSGEPDKQAMLALARAFPGDNLHILDLPYRLSSWALDDPDNVGLWVDAQGRLLAWAVLQTPFWTVDCACQPHASQDLHRHVLAWADARARAVLDTPAGRPMWFVHLFASQLSRIGDLEAAGFACQADVGPDSWSKVLMQRSAHVPLAASPLPPGFTIRPLAGEPEVEAYVGLHQAVFESKNMTAGWRAETLRRPEYRADLDLVAEAPDGRLAAFCIAWLDPGAEPPAGQIEPLGVHRDWRQLGLGQAILSEALRRLQRSGAQNVYVETDRERNAALALYEAAGFRVIQEVPVYRKEVRR
jgi:mycothiol synthase